MFNTFQRNKIMEIVKSTFKEIPDVFGIVIMGCATDKKEYLDGWINGVTAYLVQQGVLPEGTTADQAWDNIFETTSTGGRTDLIYIGKEGAPFNVGRFAIVRLAMADCSWIEDWLVNYANHYGEEPRGRHASAWMNREHPLDD
jgi:hypothetical protein